jgi:diguanylate cyclase (GGDEF)-like protein
LIAENVRAKVAEKPLTSGADKKKLGIISVSVGVATMRSDDDEISLLQRVDQLLYQAKRCGRNRVIGENDKLAPR